MFASWFERACVWNRGEKIKTRDAIRFSVDYKVAVTPGERRKIITVVKLSYVAALDHLDVSSFFHLSAIHSPAALRPFSRKYDLYICVARTLFLLRRSLPRVHTHSSNLQEFLLVLLLGSRALARECEKRVLRFCNTLTNNRNTDAIPSRP